jgi:murein L,D-transpeptidase YafK
MFRRDPPPPAAPHLRADSIDVYKAERRMVLLREGRVLREYRGVALGFAPVGAKLQEGDGRTPEGAYRIDRRNPNSLFHLSLGVSFPDAADRADAAARGVSPGSDIFIHGQPNPTGLRRWIEALIPNLDRRKAGDWTAGCVAVSNREMREIWSLVEDGAEVRIHP